MEEADEHPDWKEVVPVDIGLAFLIDENLNHRILRGLLRKVPRLDCKLVSTAGLQGHGDPEVLEFCASTSRVLVTHDLRTVPMHAYERVMAGLQMPGVIAVPLDLSIGEAIEDLAILAECASREEIVSKVIYLPLR